MVGVVVAVVVGVVVACEGEVTLAVAFGAGVRAVKEASREELLGILAEIEQACVDTGCYDSAIPESIPAHIRRLYAHAVQEQNRRTKRTAWEVTLPTAKEAGHERAAKFRE